MSVVAGQPFTTTLVDPGGLTSGVGARVEVPVTRAIVSMWVAGTLSGFLWSVTLDAPLDAGDYNLVWRDSGPEPPAYEIFVPLFVVSMADSDLIGGVDWPVIDPALVRPSIDDVALLEQSRTVAIDGTRYDTFNDQTVVTADEVSMFIITAQSLILAQLRKDVDTRHYPQIKQAIALLAAILLEGSKFRNQNEQGSGATGIWRSLLTQVMTGLQTQIATDLEQNLLLAGMEPSNPMRHGTILT
jgi:hypothetical protein